MPRRGLIRALLGAALCASLAGCGLGGGDGGDVVAPTGAPYRYVVPDGLRRRDDVEVVSGAEDAQAVTAVALDRDDLIVVSGYELAASVATLARDDLVAELDRSIRESVAAGGSVAGPAEVAIANGSAFAYDVTGTRTPDGDPATLRIVTAARDTTQVIVLCRATERARSTLLRACDRLVATLELR